MSEQTNNTEKFMNENAVSVSLMRILKKFMQMPYNSCQEKYLTEDYLAALKVLQEVGPDAIEIDDEMFDLVINMIDCDEIDIATEAVTTLSSIEVTEMQADKAVPVLINVLKKINHNEENNNSPIQNNALLALIRIGKFAVPGLIKLLSPDQERMTLIMVAQILGMIGPIAQDASPYLLPFLEYDDKKMQFLGAITLSKLKSEQEKVLPILLLHLTPEQPEEIRSLAAIAIGKFGIAIEDAVPNLIKCILDKEKPEVRINAIKALYDMYVPHGQYATMRKKICRTFCFPVKRTSCSEICPFQ